VLWLKGKRKKPFLRGKTRKKGKVPFLLTLQVSHSLKIKKAAQSKSKALFSSGRVGVAYSQKRNIKN